MTRHSALAERRRISIFSPVEAETHAGWMRGGAALSLGLSALCFAGRRRLLGRIALGFAVAFLERLREGRLAARVHSVLVRSGRET